MKNRWMLAIVALLLCVMMIPAMAEEAAEEIKYEVKVLQNFDDFADTAAMNQAGWVAGNPGPDGTGAVIELIDTADYVEGGKGVKFAFIPEKADWWSPSLRCNVPFAVEGDGITFWFKSDVPMQMRVEFHSIDYMYQCYWDILPADMQAGLHQYYLKWDDCVIKEAGIEIPKGEIVFKDEISSIAVLLFYGYGPDSLWQGGWQGECYIDGISYFATEPF